MTKGPSPMKDTADLEPVAYLYDGPEGEHYIREHRDSGYNWLKKNGWTETPLYSATTIETLSLECRRMREALEPFAAFARAAEAVRIFSGQTVADHKIIQSVSSEAGLGVLVYGHVLDALAAFGGNPAPWGGSYENLRTRQALGADQ